MGLFILPEMVETLTLWGGKLIALSESFQISHSDSEYMGRTVVLKTSLKSGNSTEI